MSSYVIDWHAHVLPCVDDGSQSVAESVALLEALRGQGVDIVVATPHYDANREPMESFFQRRKESMQILSEALRPGFSKIMLGAEVLYYPGISRLEDIEKLKIKGTRLLLLEMPQSKWSEYTVRELVELSCCGDIIPVLAHIERCLEFQSDEIWTRLCESGILMQVNATFFTKFYTKSKALRLLKDGRIHLVGSDCHNMTSRPPMLEKAFERISRKFGTDFICQINEFGTSMLVQK